MRRNQTLVYTQINHAFPDYISRTISEYESLGISNIPINLRREFELFLQEDLEWAKLLKNPNNEIANYISQPFDQMTNWLIKFKEHERSNAMVKSDLLDEFKPLLHELKIAFYTVILHREGFALTEIEEKCREYYPHYKQLDSLICDFKKDFYTDFTIDKSKFKWKDFILEVRKDLAKFNILTVKIDDNNGRSINIIYQGEINIIYQAEIKKHLHIQEDINIGRITAFIKYVWSSITRFRRFANRNYLYSLIKIGLEANFTSYESIQIEHNANITSLVLRITRSINPAYMDKSYLIEIEGMKNSDRFVSDKIVTFGKKDDDEFSNDISLPDFNGVDSIFAFIFTNSSGFNLVDISMNGVVMVAVYKTSIVLEHQMVILFGNRHFFKIQLIDGPRIEGIVTKQLGISGVQNCEQTLNFQTVFSSDLSEIITIGSHSSNKIIIGHDDFSESHAKCFYQNGQWFLEDLESKHGTFYRLKNQAQIDEKQPSSTLRIQENTGFMIEGILFFATLNNSLK